jgi:mono/diheme cytochrome c family protein
MSRTESILLAILVSLSSHAQAADQPAPPVPPTYAPVHALFVRHCLACHNSKDAEGGLVLESHDKLMKGGDTGAAISPGKAGESLLIKQIEHAQKPFMPPPKKGDKLKPEEIAVIRAWIDAGAPAPKSGEQLVEAIVRPKIAPKVAPRRSIHAVAFEPKSKLLAVARDGEVQLISIESRAVVRTLTGHRGSVNDLALSSDGAILAAAAGLPGEFGEVRLWNIADGSLIRTIEGHHDSIYAVALSPDGKTLATGSYDQKIILWNAADGSPLRTLEGHNGAIFDLAFRPDKTGSILASVSGDRTLKLWNTATGQRLDTRNESMQALHAVTFSPNGDRVLAAGVDNRIRAWRVSADAKEGTNTLLLSRFAHEGAILQLAFSPDGSSLVSTADDRTVKTWTGDDIAPKAAFEKQSDWPAAATFALEGKAIVIGRLDGALAFYDAKAASVLPAPKIELSPLAVPLGVQRGIATTLRITGKNLASAETVRTGSDKIAGTILRDAANPWTNESVAVRFTIAPDLVPGVHEFWLAGAAGETGRLKLLVDNLAQAAEQEPNDSPAAATPLKVPASAWGRLAQRGDTDHFAFDGKAGQTIVIDAMCSRIGGKADLIIALSDPAGRVIASNNDFDNTRDPLVAVTLAADGRHTISVRDLQMTGSNDHAYRLSVGELPLVSGVFPLSVPSGAEATVQLTGWNLPDRGRMTLAADMLTGGEVDLPIDSNRFRVRRAIKVIATTDMPDLRETEPNDAVEQANDLRIPGVFNGRIDRAGDADFYRINPKKGQRLIIETMASRLGSPVDTKIEILQGDGPHRGQLVPRLKLRAVRDTAHTFRPIDANANGTRLVNWEEMQQNEYLYMQGEVVKLFLPPRGPDSQWDFYTLAGRRRCYFDTSATAHALDEPCYIVEPLPPDAPTPPANGLPIFAINYENDDDQERQLGSDSRLNFTAPVDGPFVVRVTDARGFGGESFTYRLVVREAKPDYRVTIVGVNPTVPSGSGVGFTAVADRTDGFDGPITVEVAGMPPGFVVSSPLVIEAGHNEARGVIFAAADAPAPTADNAKNSAVKSRATIDGKDVVKDVNVFGTIKLGPKLKLLATLLPEPMPTARTAPTKDHPLMEIAIAPGQMTTARIKLDRNGYTDLASLDVENLPHGVIVADLGLNGLLIRADESERVIFITCAPWVAEMDRLCYARAKEAGAPASRPVLLKVRKK